MKIEGNYTENIHQQPLQSTSSTASEYTISSNFSCASSLLHALYLLLSKYHTTYYSTGILYKAPSTLYTSTNLLQSISNTYTGLNPIASYGLMFQGLNT